ncbi:MAG: beta-N-acetylhexosaminidase, partial [Patescibacteria group bacterium]
MRPFCLYLTLLLVICSCHREEKNFEQIYAPFLQVETVWADSMLLEMTMDEKIGQLLVLKTTEEVDKDSLAYWVWNLGIGGWMPEGISLSDYTSLTDSLQCIARIPLLMGTAQTVALNNQFTDVIDYPLPATISAILSRQKKDVLLAQYVKQCKALNVHFSLVPALQMADTSQIIFDAYALENNSEEQLFLSYSTMDELQKEKVLSIAGPFRDLFFAAETDEPAKAWRDSLMNRYFNLSQNGLSGLMIDNAIFRADTNRFYPYGFLTEYLQEYASFNGLIFAQADSMTNAFDLLHGGVDVLLVNGQVWQTVAAIRKAVNEGFLSVEQLNAKVRKVLRAKTWLDLDHRRPNLSEEKIARLFAKEDHVYPIYDLYESALTLANNMDSIIPFIQLNKQYFKLIALGDPSMRVFEKTFRKYANLSVYRKLTREEDGGWQSLNDKSLKRKTIVLTLADVLLDADRDEAFIASVNELSKSTKVVLANFGSPFNLRYFSEKVTMVQAYEFNGTTQSQVAQLLFGGLQAKGELPLALSECLEQGQGFSNPITRLRYGMPQQVGIAPHKLVDIDAIIYDAIRAKAMPGCQILIVKEGMVIYDKSF